MKHYRARGWRGSTLVYAAAFALLLLSAYLLLLGNTKGAELRYVSWSIALSAVAMLTAVASVLFPRR
ncbi:MAG: hypothetical protein ABR600_00770 [Actinomycetota bacterium]